MIKKSLLAALLFVPAMFVPAMVSAAPAPHFSIKTLDGQTLTNKDLLGKVVVLDFWATWCGPCRAVSKLMQGLHEKYASQGVKVVCLDVQEQEPSLIAVQRYKAKHGYTYTFGLTTDGLDTKLKVTNLPTVIMLDRKGEVRFSTVGYTGGTAELLDSNLKKLLRRG